ncbi:MAG: hypothetical protein ACYCRF_09790, partial [Acidithiobacillus sp.]
TATGALHYSVERDQDEDQTIGINSVLFDSTSEITEFNEIGKGILWVCPWVSPSGATIKLAFSSQGPYFQQSNLFHYAGFAVYPALEAQLIASVSDLPVGPIVSNSLPIWLGLPTALVGLPGVTAPDITVYPSFLVPENIVPPYIVAHVEPGLSAPVQQFMRYRWSERTGSGPYSLPSAQLVKDVVKLTLYGLTNQQAIQWFSAVTRYSEYTDAFGFMNSPIIQDEKRAQPEIAAIAMKKTLVIEASYYQSAADAIARNLIVSASCSFTVS